MTADSLDPYQGRRKKKAKAQITPPPKDPKALKIVMPCDVCNNNSSFFIAEVWKVCDSCWKEFIIAQRETGISYTEWRKDKWIQILLA
jgi:hypothetical protein